MATWVEYAMVRRFPAVLNKYKTNGKFKKDVMAEIAATATWARRALPTTLPKGDLEWQIDVTAIPLVRPLFPGGKLKS